MGTLFAPTRSLAYHAVESSAIVLAGDNASTEPPFEGLGPTGQTRDRGEEPKMNETDLAASIERLMERVDYYLHCELDDEYDHDRPDTARLQLEAALRQELLRASAVGLVSAIASAQPILGDEAA